MSVFFESGPKTYLEYVLLQLKMFLRENFLWYRLFKLRRRYLFTRTDKLRLRYVTGLVSGVFATFLLVFSPFSASLASKSTGFIERAEARAPAVYVLEDTERRDGHDFDRDSGFFQSAEESLKAYVSQDIRTASAALQKPEEPKFRQIEVGQGDTIAGVLQKAGLDGNDAYYAVKALSQHFDPRKVKSGQKIGLYFEKDDNGAMRFEKMAMKLDPVKELHIVKETDEKFTSELEEKELVQRSYGRSAEIQTSLYGSAARSGIPQQVIAELIRIYSWDIDFQRDIRQGDKLQVLYDTYETEDGEFARYGDILYANLTVGGKDVPIYRFEMNDGRVDYFEPDGHSIRKTLMKTPIDGARVSSGFGMRKHPVLGYNKIHKGIDFAAPTGTPIYAAGDGVVEYAGRNGSFGNYIRIRHNAKIKTAYAHMHKVKSGVSVGKRVEQGQIIGYVGTTGRSTGAHLHYEVLANGRQIDPRSVKLPTGEQLEGKDLARFKSLIGALDQQYVSLTDGLKFAGHESDTEINPVR